MYRLFISLRYLLRKRICILAVLGVAFGVMALVVVHSVMTGFEQNIRSRIRGSLADIIVEKWGSQYFTGYDALAEQLTGIAHIEAAAPRLEGLALAKLGKSEDYRYAQFVGIDLEREMGVSELEDYWLKGQQRLKERNETHEIVEEPRWGEASKEAISPAIVGVELMVVGRDTEGHRVMLDMGERVTLVTISGPFDHQLLPTEITGAFKSGMYEYDLKTVYVPLRRAQLFTEKPGQVSAIHVQLDDYANVEAARAGIIGIPTIPEIRRMEEWIAFRDPMARSIYADLMANYRAWRNEGHPSYVRNCLALQTYFHSAVEDLKRAGRLAEHPHRDAVVALADALEERKAKSLGFNYRVSTWEDKQRNFLQAVEIERAVTLVIHSFLFLLAWFVIYSILSAMVAEKTRDIGTLKAIGATTGGVMSIFLLNGLLIGLTGSVLGAIGGLVFCDNINAVADGVERVTGFTVFPQNIYYLDQIPVDSEPMGWIVVVGIIAVSVSVLASLLPALKAARLDPVEALRYE